VAVAAAAAAAGQRQWTPLRLQQAAAAAGVSASKRVEGCECRRVHITSGMAQGPHTGKDYASVRTRQYPAVKCLELLALLRVRANPTSAPGLPPPWPS
jgi:hypothetical protein